MLRILWDLQHGPKRYGEIRRGLSGTMGPKEITPRVLSRELKTLTEMGLLAANGAVGFTDGVGAIADALVMRRVLAYARTFDLLVLQHPEEPSLARAGVVSEGEIATRLGLPGITPAAEVIMIERDLRLVEITGARYHAAHISTAAGIAATSAIVPTHAIQEALSDETEKAPPISAISRSTSCEVILDPIIAIVMTPIVSIATGSGGNEDADAGDEAWGTRDTCIILSTKQNGVSFRNHR